MANNSSNPPNWNLIKIDRDGSCAFHAIMHSLSYQSNNNYKRISNNPSLRITLNHSGINFNKKSGFALRYFCANELEKLIEKLKESNGKTSIALIKKYKLNNITENSNSGITANNAKNEINYLNALIKKFRNFKLNESTNEWATEQIITIISPLIKKNIFIYYRGTWRAYIYEKPCNSNNSVFIKYNGENHYDALIPTNGKIFKNRFNIPITLAFNYDFLRNV